MQQLWTIATQKKSGTDSVSQAVVVLQQPKIMEKIWTKYFQLQKGEPLPVVLYEMDRLRTWQRMVGKR